MDRAEAVLTAQADATLDASRPDFTQLEDITCIVAYDLAKPIHDLMMCEGASVECYEEALNKLRMALHARYLDI